MTAPLFDVRQIENLLKDPNEGGDSSDDDIDRNPVNPGTIGAKSADKKTENPAKPIEKGTNDIWDETEVEEKPVVDFSDPRPQPDYDMNYSQNVSAEDMFLQMGYKNQSTSCCENLILRIWLDVKSAKEIDLDVKPELVDCRTKSHRLTLPLPHPVDEQNCRAKFDIDTGVLTLTLALNRDLEFLNKA